MLLLIRFPVTDKPTRRAVGPARNRVAGGHMPMSAIALRATAERRRLAALYPARASSLLPIPHACRREDGCGPDTP